MQTKEKVQEAIISRLQARSGLDLKSLDVTTTGVTFDNNKAYATVSFHPKGDPSVNSGLLMKYTLEQRDGKWQVVNVGNPHGGSQSGHAGMGQGELPPGLRM
jgi:hypothetical protein